MSDVQVQQPQIVLRWEDIARAVFMFQGISSGLWRFGASLRFAGITGGWAGEGNVTEDLPVGLIGFDGIALFETNEPGPMVFDAAALLGGTPEKKAQKSSRPIEPKKVRAKGRR